MPVSQISVFTESRPGHLLRVLDVIKAAGVSLRGYSVSDTGDYGIARFIVDRPQDAASALKDEGFACNINDVMCLELEDRPGVLARTLEVLSDSGINISYSYSLISTYIVIGCNDVESLEGLLAGSGVRILAQDDLA